MRALFARGAAGHGHGGDGGRVSPAQEGGEDDSAAVLRDFLQNIASVGNGADGDDHNPGLEGIEVEASELLVREDGKNDGAEEQELGEGKNLVRSRALREHFKAGLQFEEQEAGDAERGGDPEVVVEDQSADDIGGESGHFRSHTRGFGAHEFVPVGQQQESADNKKAKRHREQLRSRERGDGVTEKSDQREGADAAE